MDRIIEVKVFGNHLAKDSKNAGTRGEANMTTLRITFDEGWDDFDKRVVFYDARGLNPVKISLLPTIAESERVYLVPIPGEPMAIAGMLTFVVEGTKGEKVQRSLSDKLMVSDSPDTSGADDPVPPTEDELAQLRHGIEEIKTNIIEVKDAKEIIEESVKEAEESKTNAKKYSEQAVASVGKGCYIGDNGNWIVWNISTQNFYDTGIRAQAGAEVYVGSNPPPTAGVWIDPNGKKSAYTAEEVDAMLAELRTHYVEGKVYGEVHFTTEDTAIGVGDGYITVILNEPLKEGVEYPYETDEAKGTFFLVPEEDGTAYVDCGTYSGVYDGRSIMFAVGYDVEGYIRIGQEPVYHPLDERFIPESIVRSKDIENAVKKALETYSKPAVRKATITLNASDWVDDDNGCYQVVEVAGATPYSMVDLQPTAEQLGIFYEKDVAFVAENEGGVITVYCIGIKPTNDYVIQATVTEVEANE